MDYDLLQYISNEFMSIILGLTLLLVVISFIIAFTQSNTESDIKNPSAYKWRYDTEPQPELVFSDLASSENLSEIQVQSQEDEREWIGIDSQMACAFSPDDTELPFGKYCEGWLIPFERSQFHFKLITTGIHSLQESSRFDETSDYIFRETILEFKKKGFYLVSSIQEENGGIFTGEIKGLAKNKTTGQKVGIIISIIGSTLSEGCVVTITAYCKDKSILPLVIEDIEQGLWQ